MTNWDDLRYFLAVARGRTLGAASKTLRVDATTVARRMERLSVSINADLFEHGATGQTLTASGEALLTYAEEVERSILSAGDVLTGERGRLAGTVRISLSEGFATWVVARHLPSFHARHPDIALEVVSTNGFLNPSKREADLAVMLGRPVKGPLMVRKLTDYTLGLYAARNYLDHSGAPNTVADLQRHTLIGYIPDFIYADELRYLSEIDDALVPVLSSTSINAQHAMVHAGAGIGVLPTFIGGQDDSLVRLLPGECLITRSFWSVVHRDVRNVARIRAVTQWLDEIVRDQMGLFVSS